jgi:hypothetical protein
VREWAHRLAIPLLGNFGIRTENIPAIVSAAENKNNPANLSNDEMTEIIRERI